MKNWFGKKRRICFYGGAGVGKTTVASHVFSELKTKKYSVEYIPEYVKFWTYFPKSPVSFDPVYIMAKQLYKEDTILSSGVDFIVTDTSLMLQYFYGKLIHCSCFPLMLEIAKAVEEKYPSIHILLDRESDDDYDEVGRYQTLEEAKEIDIGVKQTLLFQRIEYKAFFASQRKEIMDYVIESIKD